MSVPTLSSSISLDELKGDLSSHEVIIAYGEEKERLYRRLASWLTKGENRYLVLIADEEEEFLRLKQSVLAQDSPQASPQASKVRLYFYREGNEELFKEIAWEFLFLRFTFFFVSGKEEKMQEIFSGVLSYHRGIDLLASDYRDLGVQVVKNMIGNQRLLSRSYRGESLRGAFRGIPLIVCGAGVSLQAAIPELSKLQDRALIIAGGSAVSLLSAHQMRPHFCAHIDPAPCSERFLRQDAFEIPHFYQSRFSSAFLSKVQGPLVWMAEGNYPIEQWIREEYGLVEEGFDGGWTAANFCAAIGALLGCNPIILVGVDFCANEGGDGWIVVRDAAGKEVFSKNDWVKSAEWMGAFAADHPEIRWIRAAPSEGLEIAGVETMDFKAIAEMFLEDAYDLSGLVHAVVKGGKATGVSQLQVDLLLTKFKESLTRCVQVCDRMLILWEKHFPASPLEKGEYVLLETELEEESAYQYLVGPVWQMWKRPIVRNSSHVCEEQIHRLLFFKRVLDAHLEGLL